MLASIIRKIAPDLRDSGNQWRAAVAVAVCLPGTLSGGGLVRLIAGVCLAIVAVVIGIGAWFTWVAPCRVGNDEEDEEDTGLPWLPPV